MDRLILFFRRNSWARRGLSVTSLALVVAAVGLLGYPLYTNFEQGRIQDKKDTQLASPDLRARYQQRNLRVGDALTRIKIPKIGVDVVVVEGITMAALKAGAGHYPSSPLPCEEGNVAIAGHRTTYGKPFAQLDRLAPGDQIILETPIGTCTYEVSRRTGASNPFIVEPTNQGVVDNTPGEHNLTLTTCHPKGSAKQRLVLRARLTQGAVAA